MEMSELVKQNAVRGTTALICFEALTKISTDKAVQC